MTLKKHLVKVKALNNIELINIGINILRKNKPVMEAKKEVTASGFPITYLSFIEENKTPFTLKTYNTSKNWDGVLEYSHDTQNWSEWDGAEISSSNNGKLYLRGTENNKVSDYKKPFVLTDNKRIRCIGNIENLLDYKTVEAGNHPVMADYCYYGIFRNCTSLTKAPDLPATTLANNCYSSMFESCTSLTKAPELPATTLAESCYQRMFWNCKSLTKAPELPATTLANSCYYMMFMVCTSLTQAPDLPATTLAVQCYYDMFSGCTSLVVAPELPATNLAYACYNYMFNGCTSLTKAPDLPATTLANYCYSYMFQGCTSLTKAPDLPATTLANYCYRSMFKGCTALTGTIHCPVSTKNNENSLDKNVDNIPTNTATVVYDL